MELFYLTMLGLLAGVFAAPKTVVELSREFARQGDEVTITCKVSDADPMAPVKLNKYIRVSEVDEETGQRKIYDETIALNDILEDPYDTISRISINTVTTGSTGREYVLRITNLQPEDTAAYVCQIAGTEAYDSKTFNVYTMPEIVQFMNFSTWDRNIDVLHLEEGETENVGCMAIGGIPKPRFEIIVGELNYTEKFKHHESSIVKPDCYREGVIDGSCPLHYSTESEVEAMNFKPLYKADGHYLECRAYIDGSGMEPMTAKLRLEMTYRPKFFCFRKHKVALYTKKYELTCNVLTNPKLEEVRFEFSWNGKTENLMPGQSTSSQEIEFLAKKSVSYSETEVTLRIDEVTEKHYDIKFKLSAQNNLGTNETVLELVDETYVRGSSNVAVFSGVLALLVCVLSIFMS